MDVVDEKESKAKKNKPSMNIGGLLAKGRNKKNLSKEDVAKKMNLTLSTITALEKNNYPKDTPLIFTRGYIRAYAKLIGADVESISVEFDRQTQEDQSQIKMLESISPFKTRNREVNSNSFLIKLMTVFIVIALMSFGMWELWKRIGQSKQDTLINEIVLSSTSESNNLESDVKEKGAREDSAEKSILTQKSLITEKSNQAITTEVAASEQKLEVILDSAIDSTKNNQVNSQVSNATETIKNAEQTKENLVEASEKITGPVSKAEFNFSGDCWVKITDVNGDVLAIGIKRAGKNISISGIAPITVILGEPSVAKVSFEGENYDLSRFQAGRRARFILQ